MKWGGEIKKDCHDEVYVKLYGLLMTLHQSCSGKGVDAKARGTDFPDETADH